MAYKPPTTLTSDPAQKEPVIQGSSDQKPYVGKPKPMPPTPKPPRRPVYGSSDGSGFDFQKYLAGKHRPRPVQILPGRGQGPMPVGTKLLPSPVVKDPRTGGFDPGKFNDPFYRGTRFPSPEEIAQHEADRAAGGLGGGYTADMGDNRLYRDPSTEPGNPEFRNFLGVIKPGGMGPGGQDPMYGGAGTGPSYGGGPKGASDVSYGAPVQRGPGRWGNPGMTRGGDIGFGEDPNKRYGGGSAAPWLDGKILPMDIGPGSANQRAQDSLRAEWEAKNGGGMTAINRDARINPDGSVSGRNSQNGWDPYQPNGGVVGNNLGRLSLQAIANGETNDVGMQGGVNVGGGKPQYQGMGGQGVPPGAPGGPPPVGTGPGSMGKPQQVNSMPSREGGASHRGQQAPQPVNPQVMQQGAQALYNDNTIPHEFKGQLLQAAQSGDPQAFNEMLFNSNIPHETKLRLQQMFGYGGQQFATPDQGQNQVQQGIQDISGVKGSPYYGAFYQH